MRIVYVMESDILNIEFLSDVEIANSMDHDGVIIDYSEDGRIVGIEILEASKRVSKDPLHLIDVAIVAGRPASP